jgi:HK97 gp10 family phage protein
MFKLVTRLLPWKGDDAKSRFDVAGRMGAEMAAQYVAGRARVYCPVDTGRLRASIDVDGTQAGAKWNVVVPAYYAKYVEFGTLHGNYWIAPNPFFRRALADGRKEFPRILGGALATAFRGQHLGTTFDVI